MIRDHLAPVQRGSHVVDVHDLRARDEEPEHVDQVAPFAGVMFGGVIGLFICAALYLGAHVVVAIWRAHHP